MIATCWPWEASRWIKDRPLAKVLQIRNPDGSTINELPPLFEVFNQQFNKPNANTAFDFGWIESLPEKPTRSFLPFSPVELTEARQRSWTIAHELDPSLAFP